MNGTSSRLSEQKTLGVILAGGASRRFGYHKAAAVLDGVTLVERVIARARPQVDALVLNAMSEKTALALTIIPDFAPGEGPLAGVLAGLAWARERGFGFVATFPCDVPFLPADLVNRLREQLIATKADYCIARCGEQEHRAFALWDVSCAALLKDAFLDGLRSLRDVSGVLTKAVADVPVDPECLIGDPFQNINTPDDLALAARWLASHPTS
jgi:molybdenum cofactor guanylyltransferase